MLYDGNTRYGSDTRWGIINFDTVSVKKGYSYFGAGDFGEGPFNIVFNAETIAVASFNLDTGNPVSPDTSVLEPAPLVVFIKET